MANAEVAASLLSRIQQDIRREYDVEDAPHELLVKLQRTQRKALANAIEALRPPLARSKTMEEWAAH